MAKEKTTITLDGGLLDEAHKRFMNVSGVCNEALRDKLNKNVVEIDEPLNCQFCGKEEVKETASEVEHSTNTKNPIKHPNNLTWLYPDEKWICNACLRRFAKSKNICQ